MVVKKHVLLKLIKPFVLEMHDFNKHGTIGFSNEWKSKVTGFSCTRNLNSNNSSSFDCCKKVVEEGKVLFPVGTLFLSLTGKRKDKTFKCLPWDKNSLEGLPEGICPSIHEYGLPYDFVEPIRPKSLSEEELAESPNENIREIAIESKLKRLLEKGIVQATVGKKMIDFVDFYHQVSEGKVVYIKQGAKFSDRYGGMRVSTIYNNSTYQAELARMSYKEICLASQEEALTSSSEELRLQAASMALYFASKVKTGLSKRYGQARKGFSQMERLIDNLTAAKQVIPQEIGRINTDVRKQISTRLIKLAEELELKEAYNKFRQQLEAYKEQAADIVQEMLNKS